MGEIPHPVAPSLSNPDAAQWNRDLLLAFQTELQVNPEADLMSMFPSSYRLEHRNSQYRQISYAAKINLRTLHDLRDTLRDEPEVNILSKFPKNYTRRIKMATGPKVMPLVEKSAPGTLAPEFRTGLDFVKTATIVFSLSDEVVALLARLSGGSLNDWSGRNGEALVLPLKKLLWKSSKLWENPLRGVVVKCNDDVVAKVILGNKDYTEYASMEFLAEHAPDIPAPRPHGLIAFGPFRVIFMSYISDTTLAQAWSDLSHKGKLSIQQQLEDIFCRLRSLRPDEGTTLGGVRGEGAKELRVNECALFKGIATATEFSNLQFSARHHGSNTYAMLLRSLLQYDDPNIAHELVFTHGDVRIDNIMVKKNPDIKGHYSVTGIIDWEDSGFYPAYYESTTLTRTLSLVDEDDWYLYLPGSISPSSFPVRWLVDRLWGIHVRST
ncbi:hypothetical protein N7492_008283 [Penicillium capsulatum]|uniref:Aminoglycoside phosphotransferase domain-containing protein n=1 Tax=Penicillium capsulatum TaxID=69766 RepID=A0A9W9HSD9_9EURO|nr:hypothetical protein N7492_008283 [Penicillium capsulatum]KAJ6105693.1 hypothetical protein N7512_009210 [Penicillium capsulatum]